MKILVNEKLSEHKYKTPEGYLVCVDSVLARTGKQTYRRNELFHDGDETEIDVDRTPEEVFSEATLASFENKPVTVEHPDEDVNVYNYKDYAVGFVRDVKRGISDGQDVILGTLVITDADTIEEIENGEHTDLSCGYDCDILDEENPTQRNIRGNHVALCQQGRAGIARIVDSVNDSTYCVEFSENGQVFKTWIEARDEKEAQVIVLHTSPKAKIRNVYRDSIKDTLQDASFKYSTTLGQEDFEELSRINKKYGIGYTVRNDAVYLVGKRYELENFVKKEFARYGISAINKELSNIKDSVSDAKNKLPSQDRKFIANYLRMISTYTSRDVDIKDLLRPLSGHGFNWTIEKIDGWKWKQGEYAHKDYYVSINGYDDIFLVTLYADTNQDWKVKEVNAYFTDSINDSWALDIVKSLPKNAKLDDIKKACKEYLDELDRKYPNAIHNKEKEYNDLFTDVLYLLHNLNDSVNDDTISDIEQAIRQKYGNNVEIIKNKDKIRVNIKNKNITGYDIDNYLIDNGNMKYVTSSRVENDFIELLKIKSTEVVRTPQHIAPSSRGVRSLGSLANRYDSINDSTYKCEFKINGDTMWTYVKADSPEDARRNILNKFASAKEITVTGHDSVEDAKFKFKIEYDKGKPGIKSEIIEVSSYKEAHDYAANHAHGWGFEVINVNDSVDDSISDATRKDSKSKLDSVMKVVNILKLSK